MNISEYIDYDIIGFNVYRDTLSDVNMAVDTIIAQGYTNKFFVGGAHVTFYSLEIMLKNKHTDYLIRGEESVVELLEVIESNLDIEGVLGVTYRVGDEIKENEDRPLLVNLDDLPFAVRDLFDDRSLVAIDLLMNYAKP